MIGSSFNFELIGLHRPPGGLSWEGGRTNCNAANARAISLELFRLDVTFEFLGVNKRKIQRKSRVWICSAQLVDLFYLPYFHLNGGRGTWQIPNYQTLKHYGW